MIPSENEVVRLVRAQHAVQHADDVGVRSLGHDAVADHDRFDGVSLLGRLFRQHVGKKLNRLDVASEPAHVGHGDALGATLADVLRRGEAVHGRVHRG